jgi:hypothetical protein
MGRLSKLMINLFNSGNISDSGICHLIKNSPKLKIIELNKICVNKKTLRALINKALKNPNTYYKFNERNINEILSIFETLPKNLLIL